MSDRPQTPGMAARATVPALLPAVEAIDALAPEALPAFIATCAALQARAASRLLCGRERPIERSEEPKPLLTAREAAAQLRFAPSYVYELVRSGALSAVRHGRYVRIAPAAIAAFIAAHERGLDEIISDTLSPVRDRQGSPTAPHATQAHADEARGRTRGASDHSVEVGDRRTQGSRAGREAAAPPRQDGAR